MAEQRPLYQSIDDIINSKEVHFQVSIPLFHAWVFIPQMLENNKSNTIEPILNEGQLIVSRPLKTRDSSSKFLHFYFYLYVCICFYFRNDIIVRISRVTLFEFKTALENWSTVQQTVILLEPHTQSIQSRPLRFLIHYYREPVSFHCLTQLNIHAFLVSLENHDYASLAEQLSIVSVEEIRAFLEIFPLFHDVSIVENLTDGDVQMISHHGNGPAQVYSNQIWKHF